MSEKNPWSEEAAEDVATSQFESWIYDLKKTASNFTEENRYESFKVLREILEELKTQTLSSADVDILRGTIRKTFPIEYEHCVTGYDLFLKMEKQPRVNEWYQLAKHNGVHLAQLAASCAVRSKLQSEDHTPVFREIAEKLRLGFKMPEKDSEELYKKFCDYYKYRDNFSDIKNFFEEKSGEVFMAEG